MNQITNVISVVVIDDHRPFREGLTDTLNAEHDVRVVGQGASAAEAVMLVEDLRPDIVLLDLEMPGGGIPAATQIAQAQPRTRIIILTGNNEEESIRAAQLLGVWCYLLKGISARTLADILRAVHRGQANAGCWPSADASQSTLLRYVR